MVISVLSSKRETLHSIFNKFSFSVGKIATGPSIGGEIGCSGKGATGASIGGEIGFSGKGATGASIGGEIGFSGKGAIGSGIGNKHFDEFSSNKCPLKISD